MPDSRPGYPVDTFQIRNLTSAVAAKNGCGESLKRAEIKAMSDPAKKQHSQALAEGATHNTVGAGILELHAS